jgi:hypothetical protein
MKLRSKQCNQNVFCFWLGFTLFVLIGFYITSTQNRSYRDILALLVEKDLMCHSVHHLGTNGHLSRTTDVP